MSLIIWALVLLLLFLVFFFIYKNKGKFEINNSLNFKPVEKCTKNETLDLPLTYDMSNGVYLTQIKLGNEDGRGVNFNVIPDLGSSILLVSGQECRQCNPRDGIWDPSLGENISNGNIGTIKYGSQLTRYIPWQAQLLNYPGGGKRVNFGVAIDSVSNDGKPMNVMGLTNKVNGFLEGICGKKIISFDFTKGRLHLGEFNQQLLKTIPFVESPSGPEFVMSEIASIKINGININLSGVKYAIWDTGSTDTFLPPALFNQFMQQRPSQQVEITFKNGESLTFTSERNNISSSTLPVDGSLLIGNYWMRQHNFSINHENMTVSTF
jgi:hypothetical protein